MPVSPKSRTSSSFPAAVVAGALISFGAASAFAEYSGPVEGAAGPKVLRTVAEIKANVKDDHPVVLTGVLAKKTGKERYLFKDATGEIRVEIDAEELPRDPINEKTRVEITGEVDKSPMRAVEVDASRVRILPAE
jgi:uncharacterized protein (TIGR00156 family)